MRIIITLKSLQDCSYISSYDKLRGFVYSLQRESSAFNQHNLAGYKLFAFSNIFPVSDFQTNDCRQLIISSPNNDFIYYLRDRITEMQERNEVKKIGEYLFQIDSVKSVSSKITKSCELITGTPIVIRIPKYNYAQYGLNSKRPFEYWRPEYDFTAFLKQLADNLLKKYEQYYHKKPKAKCLFEQFEFKRTVSVVKVENGKNIPVIGSIWRFKFNNLDKEQQEILQLGLDAGFGEMNSSGFGFMNLYREKLPSREQQEDVDAIPAAHLHASE